MLKSLNNKNLLVILIIYIFITIKLQTLNYKFYINILNPLFFSFVFIYLIFIIKNGHIRFCKNRKYLLYMIIVSCSHIIIFFFIGFIYGFSKNPYGHEIILILENIIIQVFPIVCIEIIRSIILTKNNKNKFILPIITILLILIQLNYNTLINYYLDKKMLYQYVCSNIIPLISFNILYTYLSLKGSYSLPLIYILFNKLVVIFFPIFPNVNWFLTGSINILLALLTYTLFKYVFIKEKHVIQRLKTNFIEKFSFVLTFIFCITLICFMLGLFQYKQISILSNSMFPTFNRGDVVIYKQLNDNELKNLPINSIIVYTLDNQNIVHRIVKVIKKGNNIMYQTKGDFNNVPDLDFVETNQIKGLYVFNIKYIGFPSIWLYEYFNSEAAKVETK